MRIVGGALRGLALAEVGNGDPKHHLRPTADRVRESLFNILTHGALGHPLPEARVLDLFAGTGALGLEALSRGASEATFVDKGQTALALLAENIRRTRSRDRTRVMNRDATRLPANDGPAYDLVFLDPPYGQGLGQVALESAREGGWIAPDALVVWEDAAECLAPSGFRPADHRRFGQIHITFLRALSP